LTGLHATKIVSAAPFRAQFSTDPFLSPQGVRSAEFSFLEDVYKLVCLWRADESAKARVRRTLNIRRLDTSRAVGLFANLIKAAVHPTVLDRRTISKWSRVLCYVDAEKLPSEPLKKFIKRKGGINECASRYTRRRNRQHADGRGLRGGGDHRPRLDR
jgi:hypothetical protein